jgi:hypothetical protein
LSGTAGVLGRHAGGGGDSNKQKIKAFLWFLMQAMLQMKKMDVARLQTPTWGSRTYREAARFTCI